MVGTPVSKITFCPVSFLTLSSVRKGRGERLLMKNGALLILKETFGGGEAPRKSGRMLWESLGLGGYVSSLADVQTII
jgi:hypothetical protein